MGKLAEKILSELSKIDPEQLVKEINELSLPNDNDFLLASDALKILESYDNFLEHFKSSDSEIITSNYQNTAALNFTAQNNCDSIASNDELYSYALAA